MSPSGVDVAVPELRAQAEPARQREHDLEIRARLAARRLDRPPQLHERLGLLADLEPDPQPLDLERGRDGQDDIGQIRRRAQEHVGVDREVERRQRVPAAGAIGLRHHQI